MNIYKNKYIKYKLKYLNLKLLKTKMKTYTGGTVETIIITVPHSKCLNTEENVCDQTSLYYAKKLKEIFKKKDKTVIFISAGDNSTINMIEEEVDNNYVYPVHRNICDLNRINCGKDNEGDMSKKFYEKFRDIVQKYPKAIHLDIHSFPFPQSFADNYNQNKEYYDNRKIVLLSNSNNFINSEIFQNYLNDKEINTQLLRGGENYLINYSSQVLGYNNPNNKLPYSILIEFYDKAELSDNELTVLCEYFK